MSYHFVLWKVFYRQGWNGAKRNETPVWRIPHHTSPKGTAELIVLTTAVDTDFILVHHYSYRIQLDLCDKNAPAYVDRIGGGLI